MPHSLAEIDFAKIIARGGSQSAAFEELCCLLFGSLSLTERINGAGGDGGLEAFWFNMQGQKGTSINPAVFTTGRWFKGLRLIF